MPGLLRFSKVPERLRPHFEARRGRPSPQCNSAAAGGFVTVYLVPFIKPQSSSNLSIIPAHRLRSWMTVHAGC
jgi:hypothetical protein